MALGKNLKTTNKKIEKDEAKKVDVSKTVIKKKKIKETPELVTEKKANSEKKVTLNKTQTQKKKLQNQDKLKSINQNTIGDLDIDEESMMLIVFPVANEEYAMPIDMVKEVVAIPPIASIPQAPKHIVGAANVRGNVLAIIDLAQKVGTKNEDADISEHSNYVVVIKSEEYNMAVSVEKVPDTITVKKSEIDRSNDVLMHSNLEETYIEGIIKIDNKMIILIDILEMIAEKVTALE